MPVDGLDDARDTLDDLIGNMEDLEGENAVELSEMMPPSFMQRHTDFDSLEGFIEASPWTVESQADFEAIPDDDFDEYVDEHTVFDDWELMLGKAGEKWMARELGLS